MTLVQMKYEFKSNCQPVMMPSNYVCAHCSADQVKLWRADNFDLVEQDLYCVSCIAPKMGVDPDDVDDRGYCFDSGLRTYTPRLGSAVPAYPSALGSIRGETRLFWDFYAAPFVVRAWWKRLPLR